MGARAREEAEEIDLCGALLSRPRSFDLEFIDGWTEDVGGGGLLEERAGGVIVAASINEAVVSGRSGRLGGVTDRVLGVC